LLQPSPLLTQEKIQSVTKVAKNLVKQNVKLVALIISVPQKKGAVPNKKTNRVVKQKVNNAQKKSPNGAFFYN
jgi:hypothetical protein